MSLFRKEKYLKKALVGNYIYGFKQQAFGFLNPVKCCVTEKDFIFYAQSGLGQEIGRIPIDKIEQVKLENKMQDSKRVTLTRVLFLGIFSLAAPKKEKLGGFQLTINWDDEKGSQEAIFEFKGLGANSQSIIALNTLRGFIKK